MALTDQERRLVELGTEAGKSQTEILQALSKLRLSTGPAQEAEQEESGFVATLKDAPSDIVETGRGIKESFQRRGAKVQESKKAFRTGEQGFLRTGFQTIGQAAGAISDVIGETVVGAAKAFVSPKTEKKVGRVVQAGAQKVAGTDTVQKLLQRFDSLKERDPALARDIEATLGIGALATEFAGAGVATRGIKTGAKTLKRGAETVGSGVVRTTSGLREGVSKAVSKGRELFKPKATPTEIVEQMVSPKLTSKETRAAIKQGRVIRGEESKLFGRKPDTVILDQKGKSAAQTVQRRVPKAHELTDAQLANTANSQISQISREIAPEMRGVSVSPQSTSEAFDAWNSLKKVQAKNPEFEAFSGAKRAQRNFEEFLEEAISGTDRTTGQIRPARTLEDLWELRKRYDNSITSSVKNASGESSASLLLQKDMWLDNRRILNDMINDAATGLGETSAEAFADMSDLYWVIENIAQKAKIAEEGTKGLFQKNIIKIGAGLVGGKLLLD